MTMVALGDRGQVTIPSKVRAKLGLKPGDPLILEDKPDGSVVLRPAAVYPIEMYSDERIQEFMAGDRMTPGIKRRIERIRRTLVRGRG